MIMQSANGRIPNTLPQDTLTMAKANRSVAVTDDNLCYGRQKKEKPTCKICQDLAMMGDGEIDEVIKNDLGHMLQ